MSNLIIQRALVSVSDKTRLDELGALLSELKIEIISTGGTKKYLEDHGYKVTPIEEVTGNPEAFGGRMKTISFSVQSALLFRRDVESDLEQARSLGIKPIDLVICNLYPFSQVAKRGGSLEELVENIDIGGPTMIRAAAKNYKHVATCCDPRDYQLLYDALKSNKLDLNLRKQFALRTFQLMANYENTIALTLEKEMFGEDSAGPRLASLSNEAKELRYGENPHQKAWVLPNAMSTGLAHCEPLQGKELSYNNFLDADAALASTRDLNKVSSESWTHCVSVVKHLNPCGQAIAKNNIDALDLAWKGDAVSSFGSIICFSKEVDADVASWLGDKFTEVVLAPHFTPEALVIFSRKKNLRLVQVNIKKNENEKVLRSIDGGWVCQEEDKGKDLEFERVTESKLPADLECLLDFGILATKQLKSNAIALIGKCSKGLSLWGAGMGNPNRLISVKQAFDKAKENGHENLAKCLVLSDAFFPFRDNIDLINSYGGKHIVQPGGSIRDKEVVAACDDMKLSMIFTGRRHFKH